MGLPETPAQLKRLPRLALSEGALSNLEPSQRLSLPQDREHYLRRVRRLRWGDEFLAFDGTGKLWLMQWQAPQAIAIAELEPQPRELSRTVRLVAGIPKRGFDEVLRQATELGVTSIDPVLAARSPVKPGANKVQRWQAIAREAAEQCERVYVPAIATPQPWAQRAPRTTLETRLIAVARAAAPSLPQAILSDAGQTQPLSVAIGPEGGWTDEEIALAVASGWTVVTLGPRVLRAVTAATFALSAIALALDPK
ncbi:MAG: 16S rRNA (uracil(1498)-N(3))-methyltransferase [Cyanobacteria bacterium P01_D01_bin.123]